MPFTEEQKEYIIDNYPKLEVGNRRGGTGYIDFLKWDEVEHSVIWGMDCLNRLFVVIKGIVDNQEVMQVFFQRYTDIPNNWNSGGNWTIKIIETSGGISQIQFDFLYELIINQKSNLKLDYRPHYNIFYNKDIQLYDYYLNNAARVIQHAWKDALVNIHCKVGWNKGLRDANFACQ